MDEHRTQRRDRLLERLLDLNPDERDTVLASTCADDPLLRVELKQLLTLERKMGGDFLETPDVVTGTSSLSADTTLGRYVVERLLGAGGMSAVYLAHDPIVGRAVAIKVLSAVQRDQAFRDRFFAELKILGSIRHDHVVAVHDFGETATGLLYLVMELVEGEDLSTAIANSRCGDKTRKIDIARQIGLALRDLHSAGIVHRDLKPANVMLDRSGRVKLIDFGIARSDRMEGATQVGLIRGTPEYMPPERINGAAATPLMDIYSFGVLVFELFSGRRPFTGNTEQILYRVLHEPFPIALLQGLAPPAIVALVQTASAKNPQDRPQTFDEVLTTLDAAERAPSSTSIAPRQSRRRWTPPVTLGLGILAAIVFAAVTYYQPFRQMAAAITARRGPTPSAQSLGANDFSVNQMTSLPGDEAFPSLSPDGKWLVYSGDASGNYDIYLQNTSDHSTVNLTAGHSEIDTEPAFSPTGQQIVFRSEREGGGLFIMGPAGDSARRLANAGFNPTWSPDGSEVAYADDDVYWPTNHAPESRLWVVSVASGARRQLTNTDAVQPSWSPHGQRIAYWAAVEGRSNWASDIWTIPRTGGDAVRVTDGAAVDWNPVWSAEGDYLYFLSDRGQSMNLWRIAVDEGSGRPLSAPQPLTIAAPYVSHLSRSAAGFVFATSMPMSNIERIGFDVRSATLQGVPVPVTSGTRSWRTPAISPDGQTIAFVSSVPQQMDVYVAAADGTHVRRLTNDASVELSPQWSPDGREIAFVSYRGGTPQVWSIKPDGSGLRQVTRYPGAGLFNLAWSPSGRMAGVVMKSNQIVLFDPKAPAETQTFEELPSFGGTCGGPAFSPDERHLACNVWPTGGIEIYSFDTGRYTQLTDFGFSAQWLPNGKSLLFFEVSLGKLFVVDVDSKKSHEILSIRPDKAYEPRLTPDGGRLVYARLQLKGDVYTLTPK